MDNKTTVYESYYSDPKNQDKKMNIYGYGAPVNGLIYVQGLPYQGQDHRTVENYQIYKDCGFNTAFPITSGNYWSEKWKDSNAKFVMNICEKVGIDKVIVLDEILRLFSLQWDGIIGEGDILSQDKKRVIRKKFKDEAELDAFVKERMSVYVSEPTFYGVQLVDEPKAAMLKAVGQVYRSIKRVCPKAFVQCNLFPLFFYYDKSVIFFNYEDDDTCDFQGLYRKYVETFLDETGADYILTDRYPYHDGIGNDVFNYYFLSFQMLNDIARERNVKLHFVVQSFGGYEGGKRVYRFPNPQEMALQIHTCLAFGVQEFAYFTYWAGSFYEVKGEYRLKDEAIVSRSGEPTKLYPVVQRLNGMIQTLAPVIMNFEHVADTYAAIAPMKSKPCHLQFTRRGKLLHADTFRVSHELGLVSEMYDKEKDQYLYVIQNITSSLHCPDIGKQKLSLHFKDDVTKVDIFDGDKWHTEALPEDKTFRVELESGDAVYVLPY